MELSALSTKLLEAFEKCNVSKGAELRCPDGPQGRPSDELVRAFEEVLNRPESSSGEQGRADLSAPDTSGVDRGPLEQSEAPEVVEETSRVDSMYNDMRQERAPGVAEVTHGPVDVRDVGMDGASGAPSSGVDTSVEELARLLNKISAGNPTPAELYRLQYLVGMLKMQASGGSQFSQQVGQGFESLLKQQG